MQTLSRRRAIGNAIARKQGAPVDQTSIDAMWSGRAAQLNASAPSALPSATPSTGSASRAAPETQASIDARWASIVAEGNKRAGLKTPVVDRSR
jgi:hypothetical protein